MVGWDGGFVASFIVNNPQCTGPSVAFLFWVAFLIEDPVDTGFLPSIVYFKVSYFSIIPIAFEWYSLIDLSQHEA